MPNALTDTRDRLVALLNAADLHCFTALPNPVTPPFSYVAPGDPYVAYEGANFGSVIVRFQVGCVARPGVNEKVAAEIDATALQVIAALIETPDDPHGFVVEAVGQPGQITIAGQGQHIAVPISVITEIQL